MNEAHILLVEDTIPLLEMYKSYLMLQGYRVTAVPTAKEVLQIALAPETSIDLIILDLKLPDMNGLDVLRHLNVMGFGASIIIITGHGTLDSAVEAMELGASDFLVKPFVIDRLGEAIDKALRDCGLRHKASISTDSPYTPPETDIPDTVQEPAFTDHPANNLCNPDFGVFIGTSAVMQTTYDIISNTAKSRAAVFITGEPGTGKKICAEAIHKYSDRANRPFIPVNCTAIPHEWMESELFGHVCEAFPGALNDREGALSLAHGGTLFLDNVVDMDQTTQLRLLRFLQTGMFRKMGDGRDIKSDLRLICATSSDPLQEIEAGRLCADLYYHLHVVPVHMPALRMRDDDIIDICTVFLQRCAREEGKSFTGFSEDAEKALAGYSWPGNIRQLQNVIRHIVVLEDGGTVRHDMLPPEICQFSPAPAALPVHIQTPFIQEQALKQVPEPLWKVEKDAIERAIEATNGNIPKAAALLEVSPSTIYRKKAGWDSMKAS